MTKNEAWQIFKNTGSIEAYITFSQINEKSETKDAVNSQNSGNNIENERYPKQG